MKNLSIAEDIVPIGKFKTGLSKWFRNIRETGHPLVITQNGKPAGVLIAPSEYDELVYQKALLDSISRGLSDIEAGRVMSSEDLRQRLSKRREGE